MGATKFGWMKVWVGGGDLVLIFTNQIQISKQWGLADFWWMKVWVGLGTDLGIDFPNQIQIQIRKQWGLADFWWMKVWVGRGEILVLIFPIKFKFECVNNGGEQIWGG